MAKLESSLTRGQAESLKAFISNFIEKQEKSLRTLFFSFTPHQKHTLKALLSSLTAQQAQTISIAITNFFQNESRLQEGCLEKQEVEEDKGNDAASPLATLTHGFIREQAGKDAADAMKIILPNLKSEQILNMTVLLSSITPEQVQTMKTLISSLTPEDSQTMKTFISSLTLEQTEIVTAIFSKEKQKESIFGEQQEAPTNEAPRQQFDFSAIINNVGRFFNTHNSANDETKEESGKNDGEQKRDNYMGDLDLD